MRAEQFLERLQAAMPSWESLDEYGLDEDEIRDVQASFIAPPRAEGQPPEGEWGSEVERLVGRFDCSRLEVGLVRFMDRVKEQPGGLTFARCEGNALLLRTDGTIWLCEGQIPSIQCADQSERFLEGLAEFVAIRRDKAVWNGRVIEAAAECAEAGGGQQYRPFYEVLCGFLRQ